MNGRWLLGLVITLSICCAAWARERHPVQSAEDAIAFVSRPQSGAGNMGPFDLQVYYRVQVLLRYANYEFRKEHAVAWKACLADQKKSVYARLCAAYFLLDRDEAAREFIKKHLASKDLRYRYNAAKILLMHASSDSLQPWETALLIKLLEDGSLDGSASLECGREGRRESTRPLILRLAGLCSQVGEQRLSVRLALPVAEL